MVPYFSNSLPQMHRAAVCAQPGHNIAPIQLTAASDRIEETVIVRRTVLFSPPWGRGRESLRCGSLVRLEWPACCPRSPSSPPKPWAASWHQSRCMPGTGLRWPEGTPPGPCMTRAPPVTSTPRVFAGTSQKQPCPRRARLHTSLQPSLPGRAGQGRASHGACAPGLPSGGAVCTPAGLPRQDLPQHTAKPVHIHCCCPCTHRQESRTADRISLDHSQKLKADSGAIRPLKRLGMEALAADDMVTGVPYPSLRLPPPLPSAPAALVP